METYILVFFTEVFAVDNEEGFGAENSVAFVALEALGMVMGVAHHRGLRGDLQAAFAAFPERR